VTDPIGGDHDKRIVRTKPKLVKLHRPIANRPVIDVLDDGYSVVGVNNLVTHSEIAVQHRGFWDTYIVAQNDPF
jgi:hypothetical protein